MPAQATTVTVFPTPSDHLATPQTQITIRGLPSSLVDHIDVDVSALGVGDSLKLGDIAAPEGLELTGDPDLVLADIARIDPQEVADAFPDIPIVGFTNHTDTSGLRRAHAAGFDQVVAKSALFERAHELIGGLLASVE